ncbi:uL15 family ribosomal protein, partial [Candidatus Gribaldobacteria bacterium]|nr:uL15 family ribosomal protein [Candidatus Gribaldobacteria bacterium]
MQIHQLKPKNKPKRSKRVGRGGKRGTYSGRGIKGQKARAGRKLQPPMRELIKKYPKLVGYRQKPNFKPERIVNLNDLAKKFSQGEKITPEILFKKGLIRKVKGKLPMVKIL